MTADPFPSGIPANWDRRGLPAWTDHSQAMFALERDHVVRNHWQVAAHVDDISARANGGPMICPFHGWV